MGKNLQSESLLPAASQSEEEKSSCNNRTTTIEKPFLEQCNFFFHDMQKNKTVPASQDHKRDRMSKNLGRLGVEPRPLPLQSIAVTTELRALLDSSGLEPVTY